jgi:hypothetical protein
VQPRGVATDAERQHVVFDLLNGQQEQHRQDDGRKRHEQCYLDRDHGEDGSAPLAQIAVGRMSVNSATEKPALGGLWMVNPLMTLSHDSRQG